MLSLNYHQETFDSSPSAWPCVLKFFMISTEKTQPAVCTKPLD